MTVSGSTAAPFDDSRKALEFALNAHLVSTPVSFMNKSMADVKVKRRKHRNPEVQRLRELEEEREAARIQRTVLKTGEWPTRGLDGAHLAGYILQKFETMAEVHQVVLTGRCTRPAEPCTCGNPCCSGYRPVGRWVGAVDRMCAIVRAQALVLANDGRIPGAPMKVGLSTQPELRRQIIKEFFTGEESAGIDLARRFSLTSLTVARHRGWITEWLATQENNAWADLDALFDRSGITGPFL